MNYSEVEQLQEIIHKRRNGCVDWPRGCGRSRLLCHEIAAEIELATKDSTIVIALKHKNDVDWFHDMLKNVLLKHDLPLPYKKIGDHSFYTYSPNKQYRIQILYHTLCNPEQLRGYDLVFVDHSANDAYSIFHNNEYS